MRMPFRLYVLFSKKILKGILKLDNSDYEYQIIHPLPELSLLGASSQLCTTSWYMIELVIKQAEARQGIMRVILRDSNNKAQVILLRYTDGVLKKRFFKVLINPTTVQLEIDTSSKLLKIEKLRIFRVSRKFAHKRVLKKIKANHPDFFQLETKTVRQMIDLQADQQAVDPDAYLYQTYDGIVAPAFLSNNKNLQSALRICPALPTGQHYASLPAQTFSIAVMAHIFYDDMLPEFQHWLV
ncbi:hypothetical protein [Leucothrix mucor]|uniref:hypothetical protein n=1 Tax=Leucothrix mucor TaxID=45248 RepID=UPI0003F5A6A6|nr:hypothetical protein [Leucothrix mucor]